MKITPKTEAEVQARTRRNLEPGEYEFGVLNAEEKTSKAGNEMIALTLRIFTGGGKDRTITITDYLLDSLAFKVRHFCVATKLIESYNAGELTAEECVGKTGQCIIGIAKDKTGDFPDRNNIRDYLSEGDRPGNNRKDNAVDWDSDTIPF